jgi:HSP20 family protein
LSDLNNDANKNFNWGFMKGKFGEILGEDLWGEITNIFPKRGLNTDMYKTDTEIVIVAEIPGVTSSNDINIRLKGLKLSLSGKIPYNYPVDEDNLIQSERSFGEFKKDIQLPDDIIPNEIIQAFFKNGLLEIHISTAPAKDEKDIEVEFGE